MQTIISFFSRFVFRFQKKFRQDFQSIFFQTMVTVHLQILNGELTDAEYSEFIAIIVNDGDVESDEIKTDPGEMYRIETPDWIRDHKRWQKLLFFLSESTLKKVQYSFEVKISVKSFFVQFLMI